MYKQLINELPIVGVKLRALYGIKNISDLRFTIEGRFEGDVDRFLDNFGNHRCVGRKLVNNLREFIEERHLLEHREGTNMNLSEIPTITLLQELERRARNSDK